ncbi:hypothetical protein VTN49DRAFT_4606 [Thermomyces lanuginosus]|uniref:uncharacterized protein n=1 Tax=Thermomyces lanuginosus TaxID=5541 RepID=UPI003742CBA3
MARGLSSVSLDREKNREKALRRVWECCTSPSPLTLHQTQSSPYLPPFVFLIPVGVRPSFPSPFHSLSLPIISLTVLFPFFLFLFLQILTQFLEGIPSGTACAFDFVQFLAFFVATTLRIRPSHE